VDTSPLARRLRTLFQGELEEQLHRLGPDLRALGEAPGDGDLLKAVFRVFHTLKGAAAAAGVREVEAVCHKAEGVLAAARAASRGLSPEELRSVSDLADALRDAAGGMRADGEAAADGASPPAPPPTTPEARLSVRVDPAKLEALSAVAAELLLARDGLAHALGELQALGPTLGRQFRDLQRATRAAARGQPSAPAASTEGLAPLEGVVRALLQATSRASASLRADARELSRGVDDLSRRTRGLRLSPFRDACDLLEGVVRNTARLTGKEATLVMEGGDVEMDRAVLDALRDALLHLVRNAVDHGIEPPGQRVGRGKPRQGTVTIRAALAGDRAVVEVGDDGGGVDLDALRARFAERGLDLPTTLEDALTLLLAGGVSTRTDVTTISGRGVGLDAVREAVRRVRGTIEARSEAERGTTFRILCPPFLDIVRGVLVRVGAHTVALPTASVVRFLRVDHDELRDVGGRPAIVTGEGPVPLALLGEVLGPPLHQPAPESAAIVALLRGNGRLVGAIVDELLGEQEFVVASVGSTRWTPRFANGAVRMGTGHAAPLLDVDAVAGALATRAGGGTVVAPSPEAATRRRHVLVVDDSITTRSLVQHILESAGYEVTPAVNGAEAWSLLGSGGADLVVSDLDMPGMDGYDLCRLIRGSHRFRALPVILVTALERDEERARGMEVGADAYLGKSTFDRHTLLDTVRQLLD
jgi:two-component system, chemotaxis family, sensor kinase CheA